MRKQARIQNECLSVGVCLKARFGVSAPRGDKIRKQLVKVGTFAVDCQQPQHILSKAWVWESIAGRVARKGRWRKQRPIRSPEGKAKITYLS